MPVVYAGSAGCITTGTALIHTGPGTLNALMLSHAEATVQRCTIYDGIDNSGNVLACIYIAPERSPTYMQFPERFALRFETGLFVDAGNCHISLWATGR